MALYVKGRRRASVAEAIVADPVRHGRWVTPLGPVICVLLLLVPALAAQAQHTGKLSRIGYLSDSSVEGDKTWVDAFRQGLRELGYVEGENIVIEQRHAAQRSDRAPELAAELVRLRAEVIVVYGPAAIRAARTATSTIPIIFTVAADPVGAGYVASLARPGGNVTGLSDFHAGLVGKRLELLKEAVPSVSRVAVLFNPTSPAARIQLKSIQAAAPAVGMTILPAEVRSPEDIDRAFATIGRMRADGLLLVPDPSWATGQLSRLADLALKSRLPAISTVRSFADAGGLMAYGTNFHDLWRRAATYVDTILKGAKPAELPVEQPTRFDLVINLKTATALGLSIPVSLRLRADDLIE